MKKFKTLLLTSLTAILLCFCFPFAGCGKVAGTYEFDKMEVEMLGETYTYEIGDEFMGQVIEADDYEPITFNDDGTIEDMEGATWEEEDGKVVIKMGDMVMQTLTKKGSKLIVEETMGGMKMTIIYKK